jgi:pyridinium-3,5-biscarboxylic acid mononucleotide sulfurtransferase
VRSALDAAGLDVRNLRVRDVGDRARIEIDAALVPAALDLPAVVDAATSAGFENAEIDPKGFRSGAMNELLAQPDVYR